VYSSTSSGTDDVELYFSTDRARIIANSKISISRKSYPKIIALLSLSEYSRCTVQVLVLEYFEVQDNTTTCTCHVLVLYNNLKNKKVKKETINLNQQHNSVSSVHCIIIIIIIIINITL
jgi:hypothetical protein